MEDEAGSGDPVPNEEFPVMPAGPKCPFRCQCHLRVIQCSDLGKMGTAHNDSSGKLKAQ